METGTGSGLRVAVASSGPQEFALLHEVLTEAGHVPVAYLVSRSLRQGDRPDPDMLARVTSVLGGIPGGMDLLLPGSAAAVADLLAKHRLDVLLVLGFNWRLPDEVLELPRLGVLNVHPSALPRYRGPSPVLHAIRNGDRRMGLSVHRVTARIDAGPVLVQVTDLPVPDQVSRQDIWDAQRAVLPGMLRDALGRAAAGDPGKPQDEEAATYAGFPPDDWFSVTWRGGRLDVHNQVRVLRFMRGHGPDSELDGRPVRVERTSLTDDGGIRVDCGDGPLWVTCGPAGGPPAGPPGL